MTLPPRGARAAVYLRISSDRDGDAAGVERQRQDCLARAAREGWTVAEVFSDNDIGASVRSAKARPAYTRMIDGAKAGKFDLILAYSTSRLTRRPMEYEQLIQLSERNGVYIRTIASGDDDLSTADGQFVARIKAAQDAAESARISERVSRKALANARAGKFGGGRRPFGFEPDGVTIREAEAEEIRKATQSILRGGSLRSIVRDLNQRGVRTSTDKEWTSIAVRDLLKRPRNSGLIKYSPTEWNEQGKRKVNRAAESFGPASWEPIVSDDQRRAIIALLADPARKTSPGNQPKYLGSSVYICGVCGSKVRTSASANRATRYVCNEKSMTSGNHLSRNAEKVDAIVNDEAISWLEHFVGVNKIAGVQNAKPDPQWSRLTAELTAIETRRKQMQDDYTDGYFDRTEFRVQMDRLKQREDDVRARMSSGPSVTSEIFSNIELPEDVRRGWEVKLPMEIKRKIVASTLTVTILPTERRGTAFDPASVKVEAKRNPYTILRS